jgi:hypothetical protein
MSAVGKTVARRIAVASTAFVLGLAVSACATIMHGTHQDVGITSVPPGAIVIVDNVQYGRTPVIAKLSRKDNHIVRIEMPGYQPFDATLTRSASGWVWGNIAFGGLIGLAVDAISGGLYKLDPKQVSAALTNRNASVTRMDDGVYLFAALEPQPDWVKIGQLAAR